MKDTDHNGWVERRTADRRRHRSRFVLNERRKGFDRRRADSACFLTTRFAQMLIGLRDRPRLLAGLLLAVNLLNLGDFVLTLVALQHGGKESNPVMRSLFAANPVLAGLFKIGTILVVSLILWRWRSFRDALQAVLVVLVTFTLVIVYHMGGLVVFS
jgi:hypothetical protein